MVKILKPQGREAMSKAIFFSQLLNVKFRKISWTMHTHAECFFYWLLRRSTLYCHSKKNEPAENFKADQLPNWYCNRHRADFSAVRKKKLWCEKVADRLSQVKFHSFFSRSEMGVLRNEFLQDFSSHPYATRYRCYTLLFQLIKMTFFVF